MNYKTYDKYKNSNVDWIGLMPNHWDITRFKIVFSYSKGKNPKTFSDKQQEGFKPYLSMEYLRNKINPTYVPIKECPLKAKKGDILLLWDGSNAGEFVISKDGLVSSTMAKLTPNLKVNNEFSKYLCKSIEPLLRELTIGMGVPHVSTSELNNIELPNIPIEEQKQIANYLDKKTTKIDSTIAKSEELVKLLEEKRVALINHVVTKGLNPDVAMKDSGIDWIGEIPEHWKIIPLKRFVKLHNGKEITNEVEKDDVNAIGVYGSGGLFKYTDEYLFNGESVLFGRKGTLGKPIYLNDKFWTVDTMYYMSFTKHLLPKYCYYYLILFPWDKISTETAKPSVVGSDMTNSMFAIPHIDEQRLITNYLDNEISKILNASIKIKENITLLKEYKTSLIHHVVTGKIDVRDEAL